MTKDGLALCRSQRVDVYCDAGQVRRVVDHPLNGPLIGIQPAAAFSRSVELTVQPGERTVVVYGTRAGSARRVATATIIQGQESALRLSEWQVEPGFAHEMEWVEGHAVHRIVRSI